MSMEQTLPMTDRAMAPGPGLPRWADVVLAALLILASLPAWCVWLPGVRITRDACRGGNDRIFTRLQAEWPTGRRARLARRIGLDCVPTLWNVIRGDMALCGPRPLAIPETAPAEVLAWRRAVPPGLFSLWALRQRTSIDYGVEWTSDLEQIAHRSRRGDLGLLMRSLLASLYGRPCRPDADDKLLIDTLLVDSLSMDDALDRIEARLDHAPATPTRVCFVNPDCVNIARRNAAYRATVNQADLVLPDGIGMRIAAGMLGSRFRQNLNGTDLFPRLCARLSTRGGSLYLLGARPGITDKVAQWVAVHHPGVRIAGHRHGYFDVCDTDQVTADIRASGADLLLVAMGVPWQERWIAEHASACGVKIAMGVGGLFDFVSGRIPRAPMWLRELGLEWTYRLWQEPARMWRRYLVGNATFLIAIGMQRWLGSADPRGFARVAPEAFDTPVGRAVLITDWPDTAVWLRDADRSATLLPLGDRPVVHRILETLAAAGCTEADIYTASGLTALDASLGQGSRWGIALRVHGVRDFDDACRRAAHHDRDQSLWIVRADHWLPPEALMRAPEHCAWVTPTPDGGMRWSGWARTTGRDVRAALEAFGHSHLGEVRLPSGMAVIGTREVFRMDHPEAMLSSQRRWLSRNPASFERLAEPLPGVRIAPTARVSDGAELIAPVEIGEHAYVGRGVRLGPDVAIGEGAHIEGDVRIEDTLVAADVIIDGEADLQHAVVTPDGMFHQHHDVWLPARLAGGLIGDAGRATGTAQPRVAERATSLLLWALAALPVLGLSLAGRDNATVRRVWTGLPQVVLGKATLIGTGRHETVPESLRTSGWETPLTESLPALIRPSEALGITDPEAAAWADVRWLVDQSWTSRASLLKAWLDRVPSGHATHA